MPSAPPVPLPLAVVLGVLFGVLFFGGLTLALVAHMRATRLAQARRVTPSDLARGLVPLDALVQLAGRAAGSSQTAPWSGSPALVWQQYTVTTTESEDDQGRKTETSSASGHVESPGEFHLTDGAASVVVLWPPPSKPAWEFTPAFLKTEPDPQNGWTRYSYVEHIIKPGQSLVLIGRVAGSPAAPALALAGVEAAITPSGAEPVLRRHRRDARIGLGISVGAVALALFGLGMYLHEAATPRCPAALTRGTRCCMPGTTPEGDAFTLDATTSITVQVSHRDSARRIAPLLVLGDGRESRFERGATGYLAVDATGGTVPLRIRDADRVTPSPYCVTVR